MIKEPYVCVTEQIRQLEHHAIQNQGIPENELMSKAGKAAFYTLKKCFPNARNIAVFCGGGNNGGDGFVLARLAKEAGMKVQIFCEHDIGLFPPTAKQAALSAIEADIALQAFDEFIESDADLIVDALLGIGIKGPVRGSTKTAIVTINNSDLPVLSVDLPSGLEADTGHCSDACIRANITITFIAPKLGMFMAEGPDHCGEIYCDGLGLAVSHLNTPLVGVLEQAAEDLSLKPRLKNSHKGDYGHVLIVGGGKGMPGAPLLSAMAAFAVGAGMVTIATRPEYATSPAVLPEAMVYPVREARDLQPLIERATVCIIGPGLGEDQWAKDLFDTVLAAQLPLLIDASALRLLSISQQHDDNWVLTPHPGEAGVLLGCSTATVQKDRLKAIQQIQKQYGGCVVLKGVGSLVDAGHKERFICLSGNPGMATAGMGDMLSGVIGGMIAQGLSLQQAAKLGVWVHAKAGDEAAAYNGQRGLLASSLIPFLRKTVNSVV